MKEQSECKTLTECNLDNAWREIAWNFYQWEKVFFGLFLLLLHFLQATVAAKFDFCPPALSSEKHTYSHTQFAGSVCWYVRQQNMVEMLKRMWRKGSGMRKADDGIYGDERGRINWRCTVPLLHARAWIIVVKEPLDSKIHTFTLILCDTQRTTPRDNTLSTKAFLSTGIYKLQNVFVPLSSYLFIGVTLFDFAVVVHRQAYIRSLCLVHAFVISHILCFLLSLLWCLLSFALDVYASSKSPCQTERNPCWAFHK